MSIVATVISVCVSVTYSDSMSTRSALFVSLLTYHCTKEQLYSLIDKPHSSFQQHGDMNYPLFNSLANSVYW